MSQTPDDARAQAMPPSRIGYATALICAATFFSYLDRAGISILVEPIKAELGLSDAQIGVLTGFAFSLTYALFGIPLARITDTGNRVRLLAVCLAVWSLATAVAGFVTSFVQMIQFKLIIWDAMPEST